MTSTLRILMAQINPTVGAIESNCDNIIKIIQEQQDTHDIILFPELALSGYPLEDLLFRPELHKAVTKSLNIIKALVKDCYVIVGYPSQKKDKFYNSIGILHQGHILQTYNKQKLPNYGVFDEVRYFEPGPKNPCIFEIKNQRIGLCICEDIWQQGPVDDLIKQGITLLLVVNASPFETNKYHRRNALLQSYAAQDISIVYVNQTGGQDEQVFDGQSFAMNAKGDVCARSPAFEENLSSIEVSDKRITGTISPLIDHDALIYKALVCGLRDYVQKNQFPGVLLGLSGGIDSALTLTIAVDALGAEKVQAIMMPSRFSAPMSHEDALEQLKTLQVASTTLSIEPAFQALLSTLEPVFKGLDVDTTEENIQARIRGILLMAISNKTGKMVLTTSNKSETAVGYATLYGDMAGGFAVLKDVLKTQVYALARYRNTVSAVIPERVITRPPSAELKANQTDQDNLPDYTTLDAIITAYMNDNLSAEAIIQRGFAEEVVHKIIALIKRNEYKRYQAAPGTKISAMSFGKDWRYPLTNGIN